MWKYEQHTGKLFDPTGLYRALGYAGGDEGRHPEGVNNTDMESMKCIGPLPRGLYTFQSPVLHSKLGPFAIPLLPDSANIMFGRGDFFCHGDTTPGGNASMGCLIMPRVIRNLMWASVDHQLLVY
jgi:hypothetical protein